MRCSSSPTTTAWCKTTSARLKWSKSRRAFCVVCVCVCVCACVWPCVCWVVQPWLCVVVPLTARVCSFAFGTKSAKRPFPVDQVVAILDLNGLSMSQISSTVLNYVKAVSGVDQLRYPGTAT